MGDISAVKAEIEKGIIIEKSFGRLRYLSWMVLINLIFLVPFKISSESLSNLDGHGWFLLVLLLHGISMSNIIVKRMDNIDPLKSSWVVTLWLIVYLGLGIWFYIVSAADIPFVLNMGIGYNPMGVMQSSAAMLLFGFFTNLYFLLMPSKQGKISSQERKKLQSIKNELLQEKEKLTQEQEIKKLKAEINELKGKSA